MHSVGHSLHSAGHTLPPSVCAATRGQEPQADPPSNTDSDGEDDFQDASNLDFAIPHGTPPDTTDSLPQLMNKSNVHQPPMTHGYGDVDRSGSPSEHRQQEVTPSKQTRTPLPSFTSSPAPGHSPPRGEDATTTEPGEAENQNSNAAYLSPNQTVRKTVYNIDGSVIKQNQLAASSLHQLPRDVPQNETPDDQPEQVKRQNSAHLTMEDRDRDSASESDNVPNSDTDDNVVDVTTDDEDDEVLLENENENDTNNQSTHNQAEKVGVRTRSTRAFTSQAAFANYMREHTPLAEGKTRSKPGGSKSSAKGGRAGK